MKQIPLTQGKFALVDDADFDWLNQWKWYCLNGAYAARNVYSGKNKKCILMHREIACTPDGLLTDHRDLDGLNNQRYNLRDATKSQNGMNRGANKGAESKFKGVFAKGGRFWGAQIMVNGILEFRGQYQSEIEAAQAYNEAAIELHGEFARLNIIS